MSTNIEPEGIAIIGIAAQLPSGSSSTEDLDYATFWDFLVKGEKAYEPLNNILPDLAKSRPEAKHPTQGAFLKNASGFDNISLGVSTRDARVIPYSARRLLDLSFRALLDSGIESRGHNIGCFMSGNRTLQGETTIDADGSFSWAPYAMANRISYALDLTGPSILLDTACSSSLYALHLAVAAIEKGDCEAALVGGAQINRDPFEWTAYGQGSVLSPDGMCRPFDAAAMGFGRGEGAVVVVLKPLKNAIRDHDHIYSVVLGSAINATGSRMPLNVPNGVAQQKSIYEAYRRSRLNPKEADYVELHATGTLVGDPIEVNATAQIFASDTPVMFGTVKGNIGHLEVAAFLASLVKACLIFEHKIIPPTVNFSNPVPTIDWGAFKMVVPMEPIPLGCRSLSGRPIISLSSSGLGGTTGHVVLQAPPPPTQNMMESSAAPILFLVGGLSSNAVDQISHGILQLDAGNPKTLSECAVTLSRRARQLPWRKYFTIPSSPRITVPLPTLIPNELFALTFVFSGQGPQHLEMGRQLFAEFPVFRSTVIELDEVYRRIKGVSLMESTGLFSLQVAGSQHSPPTVTLADFGWPVTITVSVLAMLQCALFDLLYSLGIVPDMMLGHSAGETAILYASGAGPKAMVMEIAIARGEAMSCTESKEMGMAMLACNAHRASELISCITANDVGVLELSCFNSPDSVAVSGTATLLDKLVALAKDGGIFSQRIRTMVPGHSSLMNCIKEDYLAKMDDIFSRYPGSHTPRIPVYSTCREERFVEFFDAEYFWDNCRNAVLFGKAVSDALASSSPVFLELSCHPVLSSSILARELPASRVLCPMRRMSKKERQSATFTEPEILLDTLGRLSLLGVNSLDLSGLYGPSAFKSKLIEHPLAERTIPPPKSLYSRLLQSTAQNNGPLFSSNVRLHRSSHPDLIEHVINGEPIFPATGFIELLLEAGANFLWDVEFVSILSLASAAPLEIGLQRLDASWSVTTFTGSSEREHARGFMDRSASKEPPLPVDCESIFKRLPLLDFDDFYLSLQPLAAYGPRFQRVVRCHGGPSEAIAEVKGPTPDEISSGYLLHPVIMDACLHVMLHPDISKQYSKDVMYLPSRLEHLTFYRRDSGAGNWFSHILLRRWTPETRHYDILITDSSGSALCELRNLTTRKLTSVPPMAVDRRFDLVFQPVVINGDIPILPSSFPEPSNKVKIELLFAMLDSLAVVMLSKSLNRDVVVGKEESRRRYMNFARRAIQKHKLEAIDMSVKKLQDLRDNWPHHFEITNRISAVHESVFETPQRAVDALYSDDLMAKFYTQSNQTSEVVSYATKAFSNVLESLRKGGKQSIKILEVGAGTGLFTYPLIDKVKEHSDLLIKYTVSDISYALASALARNLAYGSVIPKAYDISKDPGTQGIHLESYDMVVALHVLHAAPNLKECLISLRNLLVPGGCLLAVELDGTSWTNTNKSGSIWSDAVFGPFQEWFAFTDGRDHCTMAPEMWKQHLEDVDFKNVQTCVESGGDGREFFFGAQKSISYSTPASDPDIDLRHVYSFAFGNEIELQRRLGELDIAASITIYLLAMHGRDANAAIGFSAALRKDIPSWDIRLAIFESLTDLSDPLPFLIRHMETFSRRENVISFDRDGVALVPRVVLSPPPPSNQGDAVDDPNYITVRISHWAGMSQLYDGFVGEVVQSYQLGLSAGESVCGVTEKSSADLLRVHIDHIDSTTTNPDVASAVKLLAIVLLPLITWPPSSSAARIAVAIENEDLAQIIEQHASKISGIQLVLVDFRNPDILEVLDILISDSATYTQYHHLRRWIPRSGKVFLLDNLLKETLRDNPSYIRRTLAKGLRVRSEMPARQNGHIPHFKLAAASGPRVISESIRPAKSRAAPPFRDDCAYVLLGGIGGLGIDLAVWMYQHGARHLILTSRRGVESLDSIKDALALAKIAYLESQNGLNLRLCKCDATDVEQMHTLFHGLPVPVAGCFLMTLVLSDAPFLRQTQDTFHDVYASKLRAFEIFSTLVEIKFLDFLVTLSSISGLVGIPGQTTYASACTALDGVLAGYPNAFSLITPGIFDAGYLDRTSTSRKDDLAIISAEALWAYLEDGLQKLDDCPFKLYIPDLDWRIVDRQFTLPMSCRHLLSPNSGEPAAPQLHQLNEASILTQVLELLEISLPDFDDMQPLATYGLDSLSAAKLSAILGPYASFSPVQLLGGVTWSEIKDRLQYSTQTASLTLGGSRAAKTVLIDLLGISPEDFSPDIPLSSYGLDSLGASKLATGLRPFMTVTQMQLMGQTTWTELLAQLPPDPSPQPLVEICSGSGQPLIILPGGNGSMGLFYGLRNHFKGALWGIQVTESTPLESLAALVRFWKEQICAKWPHGPYRFAAYSGSTLLSVALTKLIEDAGEEVVQLTFIDHCPALWTSEESEAMLREKTVADFRDFSDQSLLDLLRIDATGAEALASYEAAILGLPNASPSTISEVEVLAAVMTLEYNFLQQFYPADRKKSHDNFVGPYTAWMCSFKAPLVLLVAELGFVHCAPEGWSDLGASRFGKPVKVHDISGVGHFGLFKDPRVAQVLSA